MPVYFPFMPLDTLLPVLLIVQGIIGGIDTLINHEWIARLPHRPEARREIGLHVLREAAYGMLFGAFAWFAWHGAWAWVIGLLLPVILLVDACDEFVENKTRVLPQNERLLHFGLVLNSGFIIVVALPLLVAWSELPAALQPIDRGMLSWILSALALAATGWALRDFFAWRTLGKLAQMPAAQASGHA
jgi:hypothetical protein